MRSGKMLTAAMALAGVIGAAGSYLLMLKLFPLVFFLAAGVVAVVPIAVACAILACQHHLRIRLSLGRTLWLILSALIGYPVCVSIFQRLCSTLERWSPAVPGDLRVFFAMLVAGLLASGIAWSATCVFTAHISVRALHLFAAAGVVTAVVGSFASGCAARYFALGPAFLFFLLYPGALYLIGMSLFGAVFGYALATSGCARIKQLETETAGTRA